MFYTQSTKMKFIDNLCPPALLYALFLAIQLGFDVADFAWFTVVTKVIFGGATIFILDLLCRLNLGVVSWFLIATPFLITALATSIAMGLQIDEELKTVVREVTTHRGKTVHDDRDSRTWSKLSQ
jgi:hypothetical protein